MSKTLANRVGDPAVRRTAGWGRCGHRGLRRAALRAGDRAQRGHHGGRCGDRRHLDPPWPADFDDTSIIDLTFGPYGLLYVAELDEASWAALEIFGTPTGGTINACDVISGVCSEVASGIEELTAITFGKDGSLWATEHSLELGSAQLRRIDWPHLSSVVRDTAAARRKHGVGGVKQVCERFGEGGIDGFLALCAVDIEWVVNGSAVRFS